jgi:hypothetical protein
MQIIRTTPNLWELLELCDSGEAVVQALMACLTAFAAVVTYGVSHRFRGVRKVSATEWCHLPRIKPRSTNRFG